MEDEVEGTNVRENSPERARKYIKVWRNKWITSKAGNIDDYIEIYEDLGELMQRLVNKFPCETPPRNPFLI